MTWEPTVLCIVGCLGVSLKMPVTALAGVAQWVGVLSQSQRVVGLIPSQGACQGWIWSLVRARERSSQSVSLSHQCSSLKAMKKCPWGGSKHFFKKMPVTSPSQAVTNPNVSRHCQVSPEGKFALVWGPWFKLSYFLFNLTNNYQALSLFKPLVNMCILTGITCGRYRSALDSTGTRSFLTEFSYKHVETL